MRWRVVFGNIGTLLKLYSFFIFIPLFISLIYWEKPLLLGLFPINTFYFFFLILFTVTTGLLLERLGAPHDFHDQEAFAIVSIGWLLIAGISTIPFMVTNVLPDFVSAFFESMSGLTTTGATVLHISGGDYLDHYPHSVMMWRALIQWLGGMGVMVLSVAVLSKFTRGGIKLLQAESPGPTLTRLKPRITHTAKVMWLLYCGFSLVEFLALFLLGMSPYDALYHTFTTMATGGFSSSVNSLASFSWAIQVVVTIFMIIAGLNFALIYYSFRGDIRLMLKDIEFRSYLGVFFAASVLVAFIIYDAKNGFATTIRISMFQVSSIMSTTGYTTVDYDLWPESARFILLLLMFIGGSAGSTSGGIKHIRLVVIFKVIWRKFKKLGRSRRVMPVRIAGNPVPERLIESITTFFFIYLLLFVVGTGAVVVMGLDILSSASAVATTLGNVGPGLGAVGPMRDYAFLPPGTKILLSVFMWIGRLEIFTVLALFSRSTFRK